MKVCLANIDIVFATALEDVKIISFKQRYMVPLAYTTNVGTTRKMVPN